MSVKTDTLGGETDTASPEMPEMPDMGDSDGSVMDRLKSQAWDFMTDENGIPLAGSPDSRGQVGTVITVVTIGIVAIIGVLIYSQVDQSLPAPENEQLNNSSESVTEGFGSAMQLVPIVLIVLVASLVIAVVQRFGG